MCAAIWMAGAATSMSEVRIEAQTWRIIPSHYPPIRLFEELLDPAELEMAYELESLTNDRLRDEVGDIRLVAREDRVVGEGSSVIMAAFTHIGVPSRFTDGGYGVYYAGLQLETALAESRAARERFLAASAAPPTVLTMRCYVCQLTAELVDVRGDPLAQDPDDYRYPQQLGRQLREAGAWGVLYRSVRRAGGECVGVFKPRALLPPAVQAAHYQYHWNGRSITDILEVRSVEI